MKYYINKNKEIFGFELDGSQDHLIKDDMSPISLEEIEAINKAKEDEVKQTIEYKKAEALAYLASTDWYVTRKLEKGIEIPEEVTKKRDEAREIA